MRESIPSSPGSKRMDHAFVGGSTIVLLVVKKEKSARMSCDEIDPDLRERVQAHLADADAANDEARELLVEIADALGLVFRERGTE